MFTSNTNRFFFGIALTAGLIATSIMLVGQLNAQEQPSPSDKPAAESKETDATKETKAKGSKAALQVGTYDLQSVFQQHPAATELMQAMGTIQTEMQKAQQKGDQQKMQQLQQQFEQKRMSVVEKFQDEVEKAVPDLAKKADVKIVALEVVYTADDVETKDLTGQLIEALEKNKDEKKEIELPEVLPQQEQ